MAYHIQNPFVIPFSKIYHIIGVIGFPFICLFVCICLCICLCIFIFVRIWIADIISFLKIYSLRVPEAWGQCYSSSMNSGKIVAYGWTGGRDGKIEGSTRGPRGPKNIDIGGGDINQWIHPCRNLLLSHIRRRWSSGWHPVGLTICEMFHMWSTWSSWMTMTILITLNDNDK